MLHEKLKEFVGNVAPADLSKLALKTPQGMRVYRDGKFFDCHRREVDCSPADIIDVAWLKTDQTLLEYMEDEGIEIPDGPAAGTEDEITELYEQLAEASKINSEALAGNQELSDKITELESKITELESDKAEAIAALSEETVKLEKANERIAELEAQLSEADDKIKELTTLK